MGYKNIKTESLIFEEFEKLRYDIRFKEKKRRTQSETVKMLMNFFKINYKYNKK